MKPWQGSLVGCALALLALTPGATAAEAPPLEVQPRQLTLVIEARGSNGFELSIRTAGHRQVTLTARKGPTLATYTTTGRVNRDSIEADFGPVGRISVAFSGHRQRFRSLGALREEFKGIPFPEIERECRGREPVREVGRFNGEIEFEGERGFTSLRTRSLRGEVHRFYRRVCDPRKEKLHFPRRPRAPTRMPQLRLDFMSAHQNVAGRRLSLNALQIELPPDLREAPGELLGPFIVATSLERVEGVKIVRKAASVGAEGSLLLSRPGSEPTTVTLTPQPPLEGTAELTKRKGAPPTWVGSVRAHLPGLGPVAVAGPGFQFTLCRPVVTEDLASNRCLRRAGLDLTEADGAASVAKPRRPRLAGGD